MIDNTRIRNDIDTAIARFVARLSAVFAAEVERLRATAPQAEKPEEAMPSPSLEEVVAQETALIEPPPSSQRVPLSQRANVFRMPTGAPIPPRSSNVPGQPEVGDQRAVPQQDIADAALRAILDAVDPLTLDRVRAKLKVSREALSPVLNRLTSEGKVRAVEQDGCVVYKPPRIEPIKRVRATA